jgi:DNA primase
MPGVNFAVVREKVAMTTVLELLQFEPVSARGDQLRGPCPLHESQGPRSRSFSVNVQRGRYQCFRCGSRGNALDLWAAVHKLPLHAAAIDLCQQARIDVPWIERW